MIKIQSAASAPFVGVDLSRCAERISAFCRAKGVTTDAQWSAAVDAMTDAQVAAATRALLKALFDVSPT